MTEDEAKTKWCPHVRMDGCEEVPNSFNRVHASDGSGLLQALCAASDCMMWEPYEYYTDGKGSAWSQQNEAETLTLVTGGDCGLKSKECEGGCRL